MKSIQVILILFVFAIINQSCSETKTLYCGDNKTNPVEVLKKPEKAYKKYLWARTFDANVKGTVDVLEKVKIGEGNVAFKNSIESFREKLSDESQRMEILVRENAKAYNAGICFKDVRDKFFKFQEYVAEKNTEVEKLRIELEKLVSGSGIGNDDQKKVLSKIGKFESTYKYEEKQ